MQTSNHSMPLKRRYSYISLKKRELLVHQVLNEHKSLSKTSKRLNIRLSTAKLILKKYKQYGKFFMKKTQQRRPTPTRNVAPQQEVAQPEKSSELEQAENQLLEGRRSEDYAMGGLEAFGMCNYFIYYAMDGLNGGWGGWNFMPVAYLQ